MEPPEGYKTGRMETSLQISAGRSAVLFAGLRRKRTLGLCRKNTDRSGPPTWLFPSVGPRIALGDGCGSAGITPGFLTNPGAGSLITTGAGLLSASIGWCWVPPVRGAVHWGPGYVGWVVTPTHVSWVPLAPREIYYGRGHYGPHSVNITNVNVTNINVEKVVYKNVKVTNAVTVIHRDTFVTGRHVDVKVQENPFLREKVHVGRPNIQPERATQDARGEGGSPGKEAACSHPGG